jgi:hypothetical protein
MSGKLEPDASKGETRKDNPPPTKKQMKDLGKAALKGANKK